MFFLIPGLSGASGLKLKILSSSDTSGKNKASLNKHPAEDTGIYSDLSDSPSIEQFDDGGVGDPQSNKIGPKPSTTRHTKGRGSPLTPFPTSLVTGNGEDSLRDSPHTRRIVVLKDSLNNRDLSSVELPESTHVVPGRVQVKVPRIGDERRVVQTGRRTVVNHTIVINETSTYVNEHLVDQIAEEHSEQSQDSGSDDERKCENQGRKMGNRLPQNRVVKVKCQEEKAELDVEMAEVSSSSDEEVESEKEYSDGINDEKTKEGLGSGDSDVDSPRLKKSEGKDREIIDCGLDEDDYSDNDGDVQEISAAGDLSEDGTGSVVDVGIGTPPESSDDNSDMDAEGRESRTSLDRGPTGDDGANGKKLKRRDEKVLDLSPYESDSSDDEVSFPKHSYHKPYTSEREKSDDSIIEIGSSEEDSKVDELQESENRDNITDTESDLPDYSGMIFNRNSPVKKDGNAFGESSTEMGSLKKRSKRERTKQKEQASLNKKNLNEKKMKDELVKPGTSDASSEKRGKNTEEIDPKPMGKKKAVNKRKVKVTIKPTVPVRVRSVTINKDDISSWNGFSSSDENDLPKAQEPRKTEKTVKDDLDSELPECSSSDDNVTDVEESNEGRIEKDVSDSELPDWPSSDENHMEVQESEERESKEKSFVEEDSDAELSDFSPQADYSRETSPREGRSDKTDYAKTTSASAKGVLKDRKKSKGPEVALPLSDNESSTGEEIDDGSTTKRVKEEGETDEEASDGEPSRSKDMDDRRNSRRIKDEAITDDDDDDDGTCMKDVGGQMEDIKVKAENHSDTGVDDSVEGDHENDNHSGGGEDIRTVRDWLDTACSQPNTQTIPEAIIKDEWDPQMFDDSWSASPDSGASASDSKHNEDQCKS